MKRLYQIYSLCAFILFNLQLFAQPVNSPDYPLTSQANIDQYNPSVFVNPLNPAEVINSNVRFNHTQQGQVIIYSAQPGDFYQTQNAGNVWSGYNLPSIITTNNCPSVQIDQNGRYYVNYGDGNAGIYLAWSDNKGANWQQKQLKARPNKPFFYINNCNFWIDNSERSMHRGNKYSIWRFIGIEAHDYCIEFTRSEFGSDEWSNTVNICENEPSGGTFEEWPEVKTGPFGEVYACWMNHENGPGTGETSIGFNSSFDGGKTFGINYEIQQSIKGLSGYTNLIGLNLISAPSMAVDISGGLNDGKIYVVWANVGVPGINTGQDVDIYLISSDSHGSSWSEPVRVNQDASGLSKEHFLPAITCDPETGTVTVIYYDNRNTGSNMAEVWGSISYDGASSFTDFKISDVTLNRTNLYSIENGFLSNKICVSAANGKVFPVWADFRNNFCRTVTSPFNEKPVTKPDNLVAEIVNAETGLVQLTWTLENPVSVEHYNIYRDNQLITTTNNLFCQENLPDYGNYTYRVTAQYAAMESSAETDFVSWGAGSFVANRVDFEVELTPSTQTTYVLKVENTGTLPVDYTLALEYDPDANPAKDGGPDDFGYQWIDSNEPGGPGFDYIDISSTGFPITGITNDNYVGPFPTGFSFPFYDNYYDQFYVSSNGLITFGSSFSSPVNSPIPVADGNNNFIAWCWDDLQQKTGGQVYYKSFDNYTVIQFKDYAQNGIGATVRYTINAEVILYKNGDIVIQYLNKSSLFIANSCTIGIENSNGTDGLQVAYNQTYIADNLAVRFFNPGVKWMGVEFTYGHIEPGSETLIFVDFKSLDLPFGDYYANMVFKTNAGLNPLLVIPAKLAVKNTVLAKPSGLDFTATGNDVELFWQAPTSKTLIGYNVYESGDKINSSTITGLNYQLDNLDAGAYYFQVTALYSNGESNPEGDPLFVYLTESASQNVQIAGGWSGISSIIVPLDPGVEAVFAPIADDLVIVLGNAGMYWPGQNINTLQNWDNEEGYKIKLTQPRNLLIQGNEMAVHTVSCNAGWNLIPVLSECAVSPADIFAYGLENLIIIKEVASTGIYWPGLGIFTLQELQPGKSYEMCLTADASLFFPDCAGGMKQGANTGNKCEMPWEFPVPTGFSHTIAITGSAVSQLLPGDILGVFNAENVCTGYGQAGSAPFALTVFADDVTTQQVEGMVENETMFYKLYRPDEDKVYDLDVEFLMELPNQELFTNNGLSAITEIGLLQVGVLIPSSTSDFSIYPNPSNGRFYFLTGNISGEVKIFIFNTLGDLVYTQDFTCNGSGTEIDLTDRPEGVYFVQTKSQSGISIQKIVISK